MTGKYRIPVLIKRTDQVCRDAASRSNHSDSVNTTDV